MLWSYADAAVVLDPSNFIRSGFALPVLFRVLGISREPLRWFIPACSLLLVSKIREVEPTYLDAPREQLNLFNGEERDELGSLSLWLNIYQRKKNIRRLSKKPHWTVITLIWKQLSFFTFPSISREPPKFYFVWCSIVNDQWPVCSLLI